MGASSLPINPLFSSMVTLYILILLYFPPFFLKLAISPTLISTIILLLSLLRLGTSQKSPCSNLVEGQIEPAVSALEAQPSIRFEKSFEFESIIIIGNESSQIDTNQEEAHSEAKPSTRFKQEFESVSASEPITFIAKGSSQIDTSQKEANVEVKLSNLDSQPSTRFEQEFKFAFICKESSQIEASQEEANGEAKPSKLETQSSLSFGKGFKFEYESESFTFPIEMSHIDTSQEEVNAEPHSASPGTQIMADPNAGTEPSVCDINARLEEDNELRLSRAAPDPNAYCSKTFVEWDVWAPLEIIYEAYEEEDEDDDENQNEVSTNHHHYVKAIEKYFPNTDTDRDTDIDSTEEGNREGLIEIALDYYGCYSVDYHNNSHKEMIMMKLPKEVEVDDEDNLIEIDISPTRTNEFYW